MKVLMVGYYDDFSRFFLGVEKSFKKNNTDVKYISIYLSGFFYRILRFKLCANFVFRSFFKRILNYKKYQEVVSSGCFYKGVDLSEVVAYHEKMGKDFKMLVVQACAYIDVLDDYFLRYHPDVAILSGDSRMLTRLLILKLEKIKSKIFYFEQGPFSTTMLDEQGVNANSSFRTTFQGDLSTNLQLDESNVDRFLSRAKPKRYKRSLFYRPIDYVANFFLGMMFIYPYDIGQKLSFHWFASLCQSKQSVSEVKDAEVNTVYLLVLQVPEDANMIHHSPLFSTHCEMVREIYRNLPEGASLVVREHPLFLGKYEKELYRFIFDNRIVLQNDEDLSLAISNASVVVVNNSTVGIEAMALRKNVVVLGDSYYDTSGICTKVGSLSEVKPLLLQAKNQVISDQEYYEFFHRLLFDYLLNGHYRDGDIESLCDTFSQRILASL